MWKEKFSSGNKSKKFISIKEEHQEYLKQSPYENCYKKLGRSLSPKLPEFLRKFSSPLIIVQRKFLIKIKLYRAPNAAPHPGDQSFVQWLKSLPIWLLVLTAPIINIFGLRIFFLSTFLMGLLSIEPRYEDHLSKTPTDILVLGTILQDKDTVRRALEEGADANAIFKIKG
jgi:hypothetical protein